MGSSSSPLLLIFVVLLLASTLLPRSVSDKCHDSDRKALLEIKYGFGNPYTLLNWNVSIDTDCCNWCCIRCNDKTHRIDELYVNGGDLAGPIPPSVGDLQALTLLQFHKQPKITGPIQPAIAKLKNLNFLTISWTNTSGSVPEFISQLKNLTFVDLSFNNLSGSILSSLSKLPSLETLHLDRNKLTGSIPDWLGEFKGPFYLDLSHNQLSGQIPGTLTELDLKRFNVSYNKLSGKIPVGGDLQSYDSYSYFHNKNLCGAPLDSCKS